MELIKMWKYLRGNVDAEMEPLFERAQYVGTRGHSCKLAVPVSRSEVGRRRFGARRNILELWNSLPGRLCKSLLWSLLRGFLINTWEIDFMMCCDLRKSYSPGSKVSFGC